MSIRIETGEWSVQIRDSKVVIETDKLLSEAEFKDILEFSKGFLNAYLKRAAKVRAEFGKLFVLSGKIIGRAEVSLGGNVKYKFRGVEVVTNLPRIKVESAREASKALAFLLGVSNDSRGQDEWVQIMVKKVPGFEMEIPMLLVPPLLLKISDEEVVVRVSIRSLAELCLEGKEKAVQRIREGIELFETWTSLSLNEARKKLEEILESLDCG